MKEFAVDMCVVGFVLSVLVAAIAVFSVRLGAQSDKQIRKMTLPGGSLAEDE